ncbi:hypothetical protein AeMF1_006948 [Aphanomyces euteiches]|nr:hypothetical protein AeMF1_006948 [Aphanomyces euteiches]KAH9182946.1 hypothetical protein AeNC1_015077 [Aphanomyces euteiches]
MLMIDFLSDPNNFSIVTGSAAKGRPMRSGQRLTKTHGFQLMADFVNTKNNAKATVWTGDMAKSRYEAYCIQYKKAKRINFESLLPPASASFDNLGGLIKSNS